MSDREHFIATLQACYFGDKNAFNEIVRIYDKKENIIKEVREDLDKKITFCTNEADGTTNDKICRITIGYLKHLKQELDKEVN